MPEQMEETTPSADPVAFTRARLSEIGEVWADFAKQRAQQYRSQAEAYAEKLPEKLPEPLKQYLQPKATEEAAAPAEPTDSAAA